MYELYIRNMCLNKKRQTTGSKRVRKGTLHTYESMGANDPQDMANSDLRGMVGKIYAGDH